MGSTLSKKAGAEFIGTFAMVFFGCGSIMVADRFPGALPAAFIPIIFGLVVGTMVYALGHISGAHFNPAVTLGFTVGRHFPVQQLLGYWMAQFSGAMAAMFVLFFLLPAGATFGTTTPLVLPLQALGWEIVLSFFLMFVIISVATDSRAVHPMAGTAIGTTVALAAFVGGPVSGASMNPARTLAPAIFGNSYASLWIYFVGPFAGASIAPLVYRMLKSEEASDV